MIAPAVIIVLLVFYGAFTSHSLTSMEGHIAELNDSVNMERLAQEAEASVNAMHATMYRGVNMAMSRDEKNREAAKKLTFRQLAVLNDLRLSASICGYAFECLVPRLLLAPLSDRKSVV